MTEKTKDAKPQPENDPLCVICGIHPQTVKYRPFCSKRCSDVDLHRWLGGVYAIPVKPEEEEDESRGES
jgi:endogenous inhibitor of DNA gyrase (YacG/DUF329 family)